MLLLRATIKLKAIDEDPRVGKGEIKKGSYPAMMTPAWKMSEGGTEEKKQTRGMGEAVFPVNGF